MSVLGGSSMVRTAWVFPRDWFSGWLHITWGVTDVGATYANKLIAKLAIKKRNHLRPCLGWVVWKGSVARCYALATRPNHGEAFQGAGIQCTPYRCFYFFFMPKVSPAFWSATVPLCYIHGWPER